MGLGTHLWAEAHGDSGLAVLRPSNREHAGWLKKRATKRSVFGMVNSWCGNHVLDMARRLRVGHPGAVFPC